VDPWREGKREGRRPWRGLDPPSPGFIPPDPLPKASSPPDPCRGGAMEEARSKRGGCVFVSGGQAVVGGGERKRIRETE